MNGVEKALCRACGVNYPEADLQRGRCLGCNAGRAWRKLHALTTSEEFLVDTIRDLWADRPLTPEVRDGIRGMVAALRLVRKEISSFSPLTAE